MKLIKTNKQELFISTLFLSIIIGGMIYGIYVVKAASKETTRSSTVEYTYEVTDRNGSSDGFTKKDGKELLKLVRKNVDELASFPVMIKGEKIGSLSSGKKLHEGIYEIENRGDFYVVGDNVVFNSTDIRDSANYFAIIKGKDAERVKTLIGVTD